MVNNINDAYIIHKLEDCGLTINMNWAEEYLRLTRIKYVIIVYDN